MGGYNLRAVVVVVVVVVVISGRVYICRAVGFVLVFACRSVFRFSLLLLL